MSDTPAVNRTAVPTYGGLPLVEDPARLSSGAAFGLDRASRIDVRLAVDATTLHVAKDQKILCVHGGAAASAPEAFESALVAAQQGLDLLAVRGIATLSIVNHEDDHIVWWPDQAGLIVRMVSLAPVSVSATIHAEARDASGVPLPPAPRPRDPTWHPSFRYFRLSQVTSDLFDAYRNAYLAVESLLSEVAPQIRGEGEGAWFRRALSAAALSATLDDLVLPGTSPVDQLYDEFYLRIRTGMAHAKKGRDILLPREDAARTEVTESLSRLVVVYDRLAESVLGVRRAGGLQLSAATAHAMGQASLANVAAYACDRDVLDGQRDGHVLESPATAVKLSGSDPAQPVGVSRVTRLFWAPVTELASLSMVRAVCTADSNGAIFMTAVLAAALHLGSAARFEALLGSRSTNTRRSRDRYRT